ncbi:MAG: hypothetical protein V3T14_12460 [Myxococcota bacterium]
MPIRAGTIGIDAGATLCKVVHQGKTLRTERYSSRAISEVQREVASRGALRIVVTGGGSDHFSRLGGVVVQRVNEFEAWARGAPILAERSGIEIPERYLLVSLGTGTSVLAIERDNVRRVGGTALGGGTIMGLGRLLLGVESFEELADLAGKGDRRKVDLLVGDIYPTDGLPLPADLTAANFGKVGSERPEDIASALMGLVGENVALVCAALAREAAVQEILLCGSTLTENPALQQVLLQVWQKVGCEPCLLPDGAFCGAVGAAALAEG